MEAESVTPQNSAEYFVYRIRALTFSGARCTADAETFRQIIGFTDSLLIALGKEDRKRELETLILGHQEAMRPLLNEWDKLR